MATCDDNTTKLCQMFIYGTYHIWSHNCQRSMKEENLLVDCEVCRLRRDWALALGKQCGQKLDDRTWPFGTDRKSSSVERKFPSGTKMKDLGAGGVAVEGHEHPWPFHKVPMLP